MTFKRKVKRVIDGRTFEVYPPINGSKLIRLAGVNTLENIHPDGRRATLQLKKLIEGKTVTLVLKR